MRGEKLLVNVNRQYQIGSSPHARGKEVTPESKLPNIRIIPACAGKSFTILTICIWVQDHPRMRGEKAKEIS